MYSTYTTWGFLDPNMGGGLSRGGARILVRGDIKQNFIHEFLSRFVLQWRRQNFGSGETFSQNVRIKDF